MAEVKSTKPTTESMPEDTNKTEPVAKPTPKKAEPKEAESKKSEVRTDRNGTPIVSFQELDEPNENLPGIVPPKED